MTEDDELPAVYRSLSVEGLETMRAGYERRLQGTRSPWMQTFLGTRIQFLNDELARRQEQDDGSGPGA